MKIVIIVQNYPPEMGPVSYSYDLAKGLAGLKHEVVVITGLPHYPLGKLYKGFEKYKIYKTLENDVLIFRVPLILASNNQPLKRIFGFISFIFTSLPFALLIKKPDIFIISEPPFTTTVIGIITKLIRRKPVITMIRDFEPLYSLSIRLPEANKFITNIAYFFSRLYRFSNALVVIHPAQLKYFEKAGLLNKKHEVIRHTINFKEFDKLAAASECKYFQKQNENIYAIYTGTMGKVHSLIPLINNLICDEISSLPIEFIFYGSGEEKDKCIETVKTSGKKNVKFFEHIAYECIPALLKQADILVQSLNNIDSAGLKSYSYFAAGKPILFHGKGPLEELLPSINAGWVCETGNKERLIEIIKEIVKRRDKLHTMGENGRRYAEINFNFKTFTNKWDNVISQVVKTKKEGT